MTCISLGLSAQHQKKNFRELNASERAEKDEQSNGGRIEAYRRAEKAGKQSGT